MTVSFSRRTLLHGVMSTEMSRQSSVSELTGYGLDNGSSVAFMRRDISLRHHVRPDVGPTQTPCK
jgi:hypothetical protein